MRGRTAPAIAFVALALGSISLLGAAEPHRLLGSWSVDVTRLPTPSPPRSVTISLAAAGEGRTRMTVSIVGGDGSSMEGEATFLTDGTPVPATGSADVDVVSMRVPNDRTLVMGGGYKGRPSATRVFSLADDGQHMLETIVYHGPDGTPVTRVNTWTRKPAAAR